MQTKTLPLSPLSIALPSPSLKEKSLEAWRSRRLIHVATGQRFKPPTTTFPPVNCHVLKRGCVKDDYIHLFVRRPVKRSPIINRGYFVCWAAMRKLLYQFLDCEGCNSEKGSMKKQIFSLGAGFDSTYFQFGMRENHLIYVWNWILKRFIQMMLLGSK